MGAFDLYQQQRIRRTDQRVSANENNNEYRHQRSRDEIDELDARIDRMMLITEAVWQLLAEKSGLDEDDLADRVRQLDKLDGIEDGRRQSLASDCGSCGAKVNPKSAICQFCGIDVPQRSIFDAV